MKFLRKKLKWQEYALMGITLMAFLLYFWNIDSEGYSNAYYAAAVKSMSSNPSAFFFGSLDSGLYVTVDKPPLGLMIQTLSALVFGVNSVGLILPSALSGVGCIILVYFMVKKPWGATAGVIASGVMAATPILVSLSRTNNLDMILLFFMLCGAYFVLKAERQSLRFYILAMVFLGLGFNVKMLEAYLALPAFIVVYFVAKGKILKKIIHSAIAIAVLLAVSLSWAVVVDSIPASERPYIGGSGDNSVISLVLGYNGVERLNGMGTFRNGRFDGPDGQRQGGSAPSGGFNRGDGNNQHGGSGRQNRDYRIDNDSNGYGSTPPAGDGNIGGVNPYSNAYETDTGGPKVNPGQGGPQGGFPGANEGFQGGNMGRNGMNGGPGGEQESGEKGVLRLYTPQLSGLISWFLLPALGMVVVAGAGFICLIFSRKKRKAGDGEVSIDGTIKAPVWRVGEWNDERRRKLTHIIFWSAWLLTMAVFFSIGGFIHRYYVGVLSPAIAALCAAAAVAAWRNKYSKWIVPLLFAASLGVQCIIAGATVWSWILIPMIASGTIGIIFFLFGKKALRILSAILMAAAIFTAPVAWSLTPVLYSFSSTIPGAGPVAEMYPKTGGIDVSQDSGLSGFLVENYNGERWAIAVSGAQEAEAIILSTGLPVMAVSGFSGDDILTLDKLKEYATNGDLRYYMASGNFRGGSSEISEWLSENAAKVTVSQNVMVYDLSQKPSS